MISCVRGQTSKVSDVGFVNQHLLVSCSWSGWGADVDDTASRPGSVFTITSSTQTHTPVVLKTPKHVRLHFWHDCLRLGADSGQENPCCVGKQRTHAGRRSAHILLNRTTPRANYPQKMREDGGGGWGASDEHGNTNLICPLFGHPSTPLINCKCTNRKQLLGSQIKQKQGNYTSFRPASLSPPLHSSMRE